MWERTTLLKSLWNMFKVNNKNIGTTSVIFHNHSVPGGGGGGGGGVVGKKRYWRRSGVFIFLLLTLNIFLHLFSSVSIVDLEQVNVSWEISKMPGQCHVNLSYYSVFTKIWDCRQFFFSKIQANLSQLINFYSTWSHQKNCKLSSDIRRKRS